MAKSSPRTLDAGSRKSVESDTGDIIAALAAVTAAFQALGVSHYIGGSVARTFRGAIPSTLDVDVICDLREDQVAAFLKTFDDEV